MIDPETADDAKEVLSEVVDNGERSVEEWAQVEEEMNALERAIGAGDEEGARASVEALAKRTQRLGPAGGVSPDAVKPPEETMLLKNKIVSKL
jgi:hypothetical protein